MLESTLATALHIFENNKGFDAIVGNPPYVFSREKITRTQNNYYVKHYKTQQYQNNTFSLFIEKSIDLLNKGGRLGYIVPNTLLAVSSLHLLRNYMLEHGNLVNVLNCMYKVFEDADLEPSVFIYEKFSLLNSCNVKTISNKNEYLNKIDHNVDTVQWREDSENRFFLEIDSNSKDIIDHIEKVGSPLADFFNVKAGLQAYEAGKGNPIQTAEDVKNRPYDFKFKKNKNTFKYLDGKDVCNFYTSWGGEWLEYGTMLAAPRDFSLFSTPRVLVREITSQFPRSLFCSYLEKTFLNNRSVINILPSEFTNKDDLKTLALILSSRLISFYFMKKTAKAQRKLFPKIILKDLKAFPIVLPKGSLKSKFVKLAERLHLDAASGDELANKRIEKNLRKVDDLVLELYELTDIEVDVAA